MRPPDIALCGYAGAGKTYIAQYLVENLGYTRLSFADPLRQLFRAIFGRDPDKRTDRAAMQRLGTEVGRSPDYASIDRAVTAPTHRERRCTQLNAAIMLQIDMVGVRPNEPATADEWWNRVIATEKFLYEGERPFAKGFGSTDFWAMKAADRIAARTSTDGPVVFDDCRFPNEGDCIKLAGGKLVRVETAMPVCVTRIKARDGSCDPAMFEQLLHPVFDPVRRREFPVVAKGLNASPGAAAGKATFSIAVKSGRR